MYRAIPYQSEMIELQMRQRNYAKHMELIQSAKTTLNTKRPPTVPRLVQYRQRLTKERIAQKQAEINNNALINESIRKHEEERASRGIKTRQASRINNWINELGSFNLEKERSQSKNDSRNSLIANSEFQINSKQTTANRKPQSQLSSHEVKKKIIQDDGMVVVDKKIKTKRKPNLKSVNRKK